MSFSICAIYCTLSMYQAYIDGEKELREINREYVAHYISGHEGPTKSECGMF